MKVTRFEKIEKFRDFSLIKCRGNHSVCSFSFASARFDEYLDMQGSSVEVIDNNNVIMYGIIETVSFVLGYSENIVKVTLISDSYKKDVNPAIRVFQKEGQTYKDILNVMALKNNCELNVPASLEEAKLAHPIIQYNETDFSFIKRMIFEAYNEDIVIDVNNNNNIYVGYIDNSKYQITTKEIYTFSHKLIKNADEIEFSIQGGEQGQELRSYVNVGKLITWKSKTYVITRLEVKKVDGVYRYKCFAINSKKEIEKIDNRCNYTFVNAPSDVPVNNSKNLI